MRIAGPLVLVVVLGIGFVAGKTLNASGSIAEPKAKNLLKVPLAEEFTPDREVLLDLVEIPPNTTLERHWHPGEEFHYYLEGKVEIKIDGESTIVGTPGTAGHVPFKKLHTAIAGKEGAKILVFRVHTKGEPVRYLEKGSAPAQMGR